MVRDASLLSITLLGGVSLGLIGLSDSTDAGHRMLVTAWLTSQLLLLIGSCLLHARWRVTQGSAMAWLTTALLVPAFGLVPPAMFGLPDVPPSWIVKVAGPLDLLVVLPVVVLALLATTKVRFPKRLTPITLAAALSVPCLSIALVAAAIAPPPPALAIHALTAIVTILGLVMVSTLSWLRLAHRVFLAAGVAGLAGAHDFHTLALRTGPITDGAELAVAAVVIVSSVVLVVLTFGLFDRAIGERARRLAEYEARAEAAEEQIRHDEELLHEVRATIAGISNATYLLSSDIPSNASVSPEQLRDMLEAEVSRVHRLLCGSHGRRPEPIDLDELLRPQVIAQRALGHDVRWDPSGVTAFGHADNLTEAVHVLLTNATRYSAGGPVRVDVTSHDGNARIAVTDSGSGVPPDLRRVLFERGSHDPASPGRGIGLYLARRLLEEDGGSVRLLDPQPGRGATFVITLDSSAQLPDLGHAAAAGGP